MMKRNAGRRSASQKQSGRLVCVPSDVLRDGIEWQDAPIIAELERKFKRWQKAKAEIDADWQRAQLERVEAIGKEIDADKAKQALEDEESRRAAYYAQDQQEANRWIEALADAVKKQADAWRDKQLKRLARVEKEMEADRVREEKRVLFQRGVLKGIRPRHFAEEL